MNRLMFALFGLVAMGIASGAVVAADKTHHKVAFHVDQNDKKVMGMTLNNAQNVIKYYKSKGQTVDVEIVAYGPGLHMFRADTSPVKARIAAMALANKNIAFSACGNTHRKMSKKSGKKVVLIGEAKMVPSGVVQLISLQEHGYKYVRP